MYVIFPAALDHVACESGTCACRDWAGRAAKREAKRRKRPRSSGLPLPLPRVESAMVETLLAASAGSRAKAKADLPDAWDAHPIYGWRTPDGIELAFSTLCGEVRARLAETDDPVALATADGGWRRALQIFRFADGLEEIRLGGDALLPWADYAAMRDEALDLVADRRHPLLARLARATSLLTMVQRDRCLPARIPALTARTFLAFRGFLEARVAAADTEAMATFAAALLPLYGAEVGLQPADAGRLIDAFNGDWRDQLQRRMVPVEGNLTSAIEAWLGVRLFAMPVVRDQSMDRATAELVESFALGLRFAAVLAELGDREVDATMVVAALSLGEHHVAHSAAPLPAFKLPEASHQRGPRMADLDMTLAAIC